MSHQDRNAKEVGPLARALDSEQQMLRDIAEIVNALVQMTRLGAEAGEDQVRVYARTLARRFEPRYPELAAKLREIAGPGNILREDRPAMDDFTISSTVPNFPEHTHGLLGRTKVFTGKKADCPYCNESLSLDLSEVRKMSNCKADHRALSYHFSECPECGLPLQDEESL